MDKNIIHESKNEGTTLTSHNGLHVWNTAIKYSELKTAIVKGYSKGEWHMAMESKKASQKYNDMVIQFLKDSQR